MLPYNVSHKRTCKGDHQFTNSPFLSMKRHILLFLATFLALTACGDGALASGADGRATKTYCYQPCLTTLHGTIKTTWTYGPPNFGDAKTDKKITIVVLELDNKINISGSELFDPVNRVSEVQLYLPLGMPLISDKHHVTVVGRLRRAITATDIYPVVMEVSTVTKVTSKAR
jgi:hypothetical protein